MGNKIAMFMNYKSLDINLKGGNEMKNKLRQAYIRGMIDLSMFLFVVGNMAYFGIYTLEKYFM